MTLFSSRFYDENGSPGLFSPTLPVRRLLL